MLTSTVTSKGQTTIPKSIRKRFKLYPGTRIEFLVRADGTLTVRPASLDGRELRSVLTPSRRARVSLEAMEAAIAAGAAAGVVER